MNKKYLEILTICLLIVFGFYYIYLAALTPMLGEDEMRVAYMKTMLSGDIFPKNYGDAGQALFLYSAAAPLSILTAPLVAGHIISALLGALILLFSYLFGKLVKNIYFSLILILAILSFPLLFHISMIAYQDGAIAFFSLLAIYSFTKWYKNKTLEKLITFSIIVCMSYFIKMSGLLILFLSFLLLLYILVKDKNYKNLLVFVVIAVIILAPHILRNFVLFQYPFFPGLNEIFGRYETHEAQWVKEAAALLSPEKLSIYSFLNFGAISLFLFFIFMFYFIFNIKDAEVYLIFSSGIILIFILAFVYNFSISSHIMESRYYTITFPAFAIIESYIIYKLLETVTGVRRFLNLGIAIILIFMLLLYDSSTFVTVQQTASSVRYTPDYVAALKWLKDHTNESDLVFTTYGGSLKVYADRDYVWGGEEFPKLMRESNATFDYETLKKYNVSYVLIWYATVGSDYIIPQSNILGAYTPIFINTLLSDPEHFEKVFGNKETLIFRLK